MCVGLMRRPTRIFRSSDCEEESIVALNGQIFVSLRISTVV